MMQTGYKGRWIEEAFTGLPGFSRVSFEKEQKKSFTVCQKPQVPQLYWDQTQVVNLGTNQALGLHSTTPRSVYSNTNTSTAPSPSD